MRRRIAAVAAAALALAAPATAAAHQGNPNFRSVVRAVTPAAPGLTVQVLNYDDRLELTNRTGRTVEVMGYAGEPYARLAGDGTVSVNRRSPAYRLNQDRAIAADRPEASEDAGPRWTVLDRTGRFEWHDHRAHWMGAKRPPQVKDASRRTKVFDFRVPLRVGGASGAIAGSLYWQPQEDAAPVGAFAVLGVLALLGAGAAIVVRRRRRGVEGAEAEAW
jgi:hypothetical protein